MTSVHAGSQAECDRPVARTDPSGESNRVLKWVVERIQDGAAARLRTNLTDREARLG